MRLLRPAWSLSLRVEPHLGNITAASGVVCSEIGPTFISWRLTPGSWLAGSPRTVAVEINGTLGAIPTQPQTTTPHGPDAGAAAAAANLTLTVALPLSDVETPPPDAPQLVNFNLQIGDVVTNALTAVEQGLATLDEDRRYLRIVAAYSAQLQADFAFTARVYAA